MENRTNPRRDERISRREFMGAAAAVAAFTIVPRHVLGGQGNTPPSEKVNVASIGAGGMGGGNTGACADAGANIVALCDVDWDRAAGTFRRFPDARKYKSCIEMLDKEGKNIDAVIVATPDHMHAVASMAAMKRGKHVYCQKPLTRLVSEARAMTEAARKYKIVSQMGNLAIRPENVGKKLLWDGEKMRVTNDEKANDFVQTHYREGWSLDM